MEVEVVTVSERGQIVLPKKTRERLKLAKGSKLLLIESSGQVTLSKPDRLIGQKRLSEGMETYVASEKALKKDWAYKGDDVWDEL